jgi:hypothetical protein
MLVYVLVVVVSVAVVVVLVVGYVLHAALEELVLAGRQRTAR